MARVQKTKNVPKQTEKKEEIKVSKGELTLQIIVGAILVGLLAFIVVIIIQLVNRNDDDGGDSVFSKFVEVGSEDLDIILRIAAGETDIGYDQLSSTSAKELLVDTDKRIYILFYSSLSSSYEEGKKASLEAALEGLRTDGSGDAYLILFDIGVNTTVFDDVIKTVFSNHDISLNKTSLEMPELLRITFNSPLEKRFTFINNQKDEDKIKDELHKYV